MKHALLFNNHVINQSRPGGPYRIATHLREQGWDIEVLEWTPAFHLEELQEYARSRITKDTVFCGFGCFFSFWDDKNDLFCAWLKQEYPHIKIIVGAGTKPLIVGKHIDYFVYGFGENAILAIVASLVGNTPGTGIKLDPDYFGSKTKIVNANTFYPAFPLKSLMIKYEDRDYIESDEWLSIEFSRGCIFECLFCNFPVLGVKEDYSRDADDFVLQLKDAYDRFGVQNYYVADETFNDRSDKITKFSKVVNQLPFRPFMSGFIRADLMVARPQDWDPMMELGFMGHFYGIESFNHATGKAIGKGMNPDKLKDGILKAKEYFQTNDRKLYRAIISLIIGLPHETKESIHDTAKWLKKNWQGEAVDFNPLEIPIDKDENKLSKLGEFYGKYGYSELEEDLFIPEYAQYNRGYGRNNLIWKNEHMDINWARKFSEEFFADPLCPNGVNPWGLNWVAHTGVTDIADIIAAGQDVVRAQGLGPWHARVKRYKAKKLGTTVDQLRQDIPNTDFYKPFDDAEKKKILLSKRLDD